MEFAAVENFTGNNAKYTELPNNLWINLQIACRPHIKFNLIIQQKYQGKFQSKLCDNRQMGFGVKKSLRTTAVDHDL